MHSFFCAFNFITNIFDKLCFFSQNTVYCTTKHFYDFGIYCNVYGLRVYDKRFILSAELSCTEYKHKHTFWCFQITEMCGDGFGTPADAPHSHTGNKNVSSENACVCIERQEKTESEWANTGRPAKSWLPVMLRVFPAERVPEREGMGKNALPPLTEVKWA